MRDNSASVTELLTRWRDGDTEAQQLVVSLVYDELRGLAQGYLNQERSGHTLQPTALVHEAYMRLVGEKTPDISNRAHLLGVAARLMRQILVNHAVARKTDRRGNGWKRVPIGAAVDLLEERAIDLVTFDEALSRLAKIDSRQAEVVELRFFGGMTVEETAEKLGVSPRTVVSEWTMARAWLRKEMTVL